MSFAQGASSQPTAKGKTVKQENFLSITGNKETKTFVNLQETEELKNVGGARVCRRTHGQGRERSEHARRELRSERSTVSAAWCAEPFFGGGTGCDTGCE